MGLKSGLILCHKNEILTEILKKYHHLSGGIFFAGF